MLIFKLEKEQVIEYGFNLLTTSRRVVSVKSECSLESIDNGARMLSFST